MQIFSLGENLHDMPMPIFWEKKSNNTNLSSAESAESVVKINHVGF